ncbi:MULTISPECIES: 4Fe-4S binding protein [unclassified Fusibacter]|uniref:4Fe-4S binding protein n=1 Tax=unclassified Fusibacter TaxID=2624464 RepID=UPI00101025C4|nr:MULTISPECIES: 4Fe-4S binding protein [unclassified Fusibacter]MCK8058482.1 4Fe-4S binding protein [Fusibacter sp. A2]NPE22750.1 4Fe-4S binding protein [Fusibacter sp. A1]RXV60309.1 4Fe-4S binding protein [Fusibacter sp. A1]
MKHQKNRKTLLFIIFFILPIIMNIFSPVLIIMGGVDGILGLTYYAWTIMFVSSLFVGRAFCSYVCPYGAMQMSLYEVSKKELVRVKGMKYLRFALGITWIGLIIYVYAVRVGFKTDLTYMFETGVSVDNLNGLIRYYAIVGTLLIFTMIFGRRSACKYVCPMGMLNTIGAFIKEKLSIPSLRLTATEGCIDCKKCDKACPMTLDVSRMAKTGKTYDYDCILCGECVAQCPKKVLKRTFN